MNWSALLRSPLLRIPSLQSVGVAETRLRCISYALPSASRISQTISSSKLGTGVDAPLTTTTTAAPFLLAAHSVLTATATRGYKSKMHLTKECTDCFFVMREGRLHRECKKVPSHKARSLFRIQVRRKRPGGERGGRVA